MKKPMTEEARAALKAAEEAAKKAATAAGVEYVKFHPSKKERERDPRKWQGWKNGIFFTGDPEDKSTWVYYIRYRDVNGKPRFEKADEKGKPPVRTMSQANTVREKRKEGQGDPNKVRREKEEDEKKAETGKQTFNKLWATYQEHHKNNSGLRRTDWLYRAHLEKTFGAREPATLQPLDIDRLKKKLFDDGYAPDSIVSVINLLKRIANWGEEKELCAGLGFRYKLNDKKLKRRNRTEQLTPEQTEQFKKVCRGYKNPQIGNLCLLVEQSGIRKGNAVNLKWADLDLVKGFVDLTKTKTEPKIFPLSNEAIEMLREHRNHHRVEGSEFVFSGCEAHNKKCLPDCTAHVPGRLSDKEIRYGITQIRDSMNLPLFKGKLFRPLHGLRHALGSRKVNEGYSLFVVGGLLGHTDPSTTARYAHLADTTLRDALNNVKPEVKPEIETKSETA